jgi:hypothetical protein
MNTLFQIYLRSPQGITTPVLRTCDTPPRFPIPSMTLPMADRDLRVSVPLIHFSPLGRLKAVCILLDFHPLSRFPVQ